jgi:hypothetical protein
MGRAEDVGRDGFDWLRVGKPDERLRREVQDDFGAKLADGDA